MIPARSHKVCVTLDFFCYHRSVSLCYYFINWNGDKCMLWCQMPWKFSIMFIWPGQLMKYCYKVNVSIIWGNFSFHGSDGFLTFITGAKVMSLYLHILLGHMSQPLTNQNHCILWQELVYIELDCLISFVILRSGLLSALFKLLTFLCHFY